jgi:hypothetical protein
VQRLFDATRPTDQPWATQGRGPERRRIEVSVDALFT